MSFFESDSGILVPESVRREQLEEQLPGFLDAVRENQQTVFHHSLTCWQLYLVVSALQLTVSHPRMPEEMKADMNELGLQLQTDLEAFYPAVGDLLEAGWHRELDEVPGT